MLHKVWGATALSSMLLTGAAMAAPVQIDYFFGGSGGLADEYTFSSGGVDLTTTAGRFDKDWIIRTPPTAQVGQYAEGLGVTSRWKDTSPLIDGQGYNDVVKLAFSDTVTLHSATFASLETNDQFEIFLDGTGDGVLSHEGTKIDIGDTGGVAVYLFAQDWTSDFFGIGAKQKNDEFFLQGLSVYYDGPAALQTPLPPALPLFVGALVMAGVVFRRRGVAA